MVRCRHPARVSRHRPAGRRVGPGDRAIHSPGGPALEEAIRQVLDRGVRRCVRFVLVGLLALIPLACSPTPVLPPPEPPRPRIEGAGPEGVVADFLELVQKDLMTADQIEHLISVEKLAAGLQLEVDPGLPAEIRHRQLVEALLLLLRGDGPMRQVLAEGRFVYWGRRWGGRALVEVTQVVPPTMESVVHEVELEVIDGRWKISGFPEREPDSPEGERTKENH